MQGSICWTLAGHSLVTSQINNVPSPSRLLLAQVAPRHRACGVCRGRAGAWLEQERRNVPAMSWGLCLPLITPKYLGVAVFGLAGLWFDAGVTQGRAACRESLASLWH